jgi:aminocarboxymuconate-semialdehyde decarboxylase
MSRAVSARFRQWCSCCMDFHTHFLHPKVLERSGPNSVFTCFGKNPLPADSDTFKRMLEPERQIADMAERGIDRYVISSCDVIQSRTWAEIDEEDYLTRLVNDMASDWVSRFPEQFVGSFSVPLGSIDLALKELERTRSMNLRVIVLPSQYRGSYLGDDRYDALWEAIKEHDIVAFMHPDGVRDVWYQDYGMWNSIGQSIEEVRVMSSLIYQGVMDRHCGVKIVMAHGGGYMPHYMGRLDRNVTNLPYSTKNISKLPSEYLRDFYYDSCTYDARTLEILVERVGADRIVLGGDYPVAALDPIDFLDQATALTDEQRAAIAGGTAASLLGMKNIAEKPQATGTAKEY